MNKIIACSNGVFPVPSTHAAAKAAVWRYVKGTGVYVAGHKFPARQVAGVRRYLRREAAAGRLWPEYWAEVKVDAGGGIHRVTYLS